MTVPDYDVIVIGSGAAGMSAAVEARDNGARVLLCEAADRLGGSSAASGGIYYAAGTTLQRAQGIADSADALYEHWMIVNKFEIEPAVARRFADDGAPCFDWLVSLGVEFRPEVMVVGQQHVPRGHIPKMFGFGHTQALSAAVSRGGIEVALNTRVDTLITDDRGSVIGIHASDTDVTSHAVIVASGGLGNASDDTKKQYYPDAQQFGPDWHFYIGVKTDRGDAIALGNPVGAEIYGYNCGLLMNGTNYSKDVEGPMPGWPVLVNTLGRRFLNELADYSVVGHNVNLQPGKICFAIMDHSAFARDSNDPRYRFVPIFADTGVYSFEPKSLAKGLEEGKIIQGESIAQLAERAGIEPAALVATIEEYNSDAKKGIDSHYFKNPAAMVALERPPFYAMPRRAAQIALTSVGLRINANGQVYSRNALYVSGLYAAGESSGGVFKYYVASGGSIASCVVFGRAAGRHAAARRLSRSI